MQLDAPRARALILRAHGLQKVPVRGRLVSALAGYDWDMERGFGLAFYQKGERYAVRPYGGPEPVIGVRTPPEEAGPWRLVGVYEGGKLFGEGWQQHVYGMPVNVIFTARVRTAEGLTEHVLFTQDDKLMMQTVHEDGTLRSEQLLGPTGRGLYSSDFPGRWKFEVPATASVDIKSGSWGGIAEGIRLVGEPAVDAPLYPGVVLLDLHIDGARYAAAELEGRRILLRMDGVHPKTAETLAVSSCSGGPHGGVHQEVALVHSGLMVSWAYSADPSRRALKLRPVRSVRPSALASGEVAAWELLPLVVDQLTCSRTGRRQLELQGYENAEARWLGSGREFLPSLRRRLPDDHPQARRIDEHFALSGLRPLLEVRVGGYDRSVYPSGDGGVLVRLPDEGLRSLPTTDLAEILTAFPGVLTVPAGETVRITTDAPHLVLDRLTLTGDFPGGLADGSDGEDVRGSETLSLVLSAYPQLRPLRLTVNGVPYLAAPLDGAWTPLPVDINAHRGPRFFPMSRELAGAFYSFDAGSPGGNGSGGEFIGLVRPGLAVSYQYYDEMDGCHLALSSGDPLEFTARELLGWPLFPAVLDPVLGTGTTTDAGGQSLGCYDGSWSLDLSEEELRPFLTALAALLDDSSELLPLIRGRINA